MIIAVINESTLLTNEEVRKMTGAVQKQISWHVAPSWNQKNISVAFYPDKTKIPTGAWIVNMLDNADQAGILGYHSINNDIIDGFVFAKPVLDNSGVKLHDPNNNQNFSVASVLSHEICEMVGDRYANFWADGPQIAQGSEYALELCDPVESTLYDITLTDGTLVSVSNFVYPTWFNPMGTVKDAPFDFLRTLSKPFSMSRGGYMIVAQAGKVSQVFSESMLEWRKELKKNEFARNKRKRK